MVEKVTSFKVKGESTMLPLSVCFDCFADQVLRKVIK